MPVLLVHAVVTLVLVGLILTIQIVHYPLFAHVGSDRLPAYASIHATRITLLVLPRMAIELAFAAWIGLAPPATVPPWSARLGLALVVTIWLSTFLLQVPQHEVLRRAWDASAHRALVRSNWIRTVAWCSRGALATWWIARA